MDLRLLHIFRFLLINCIVCGAAIVVLSFFRSNSEPAFYVWIAPVYVSFVYVIKNTFLYVMLHALKWNNRILSSWGRSILYAILPLAFEFVFKTVPAFKTMSYEGYDIPLMYILPALIAILEQLWYRQNRKDLTK